MRILLRKRRTGSYFAGAGRWTEDCSEAHSFESGEQVIELAFRHQLSDVEAVYYFGDSRLDLAIPISTHLTM